MDMGFYFLFDFTASVSQSFVYSNVGWLDLVTDHSQNILYFVGKSDKRTEVASSLETVLMDKKFV